MLVKKIKTLDLTQILIIFNDDYRIVIAENKVTVHNNNTIMTEYVDLDDIGQLEGWIEEAVKEAIQTSQKLAAEKMQPMMGSLGGMF